MHSLIKIEEDRDRPRGRRKQASTAARPARRRFARRSSDLACYDARVRRAAWSVTRGAVQAGVVADDSISPEDLNSCQNSAGTFACIEL
ncbi:hypothetical protein PBS_31710 [Paraburkholderia sp. 2C]